jgi:hypothetical protein
VIQSIETTYNPAGVPTFVAVSKRYPDELIEGGRKVAPLENGLDQAGQSVTPAQSNMRRSPAVGGQPILR